MKRTPAERYEGDHEDEAAASPSPAARSSGVFARGERRPPPVAVEPPCSSFEEIHKRYQRPAWNRIRRAVAQDSEASDVCQAVFLTMHLWTYANGCMPDDAWALLLKMIENELLNHRRERRRREKAMGGAAVAVAEADEMPSSKPDPELSLERVRAWREARRQVESILARMSPDAANIFRLIELDGKTAAEVAALLNRSVDSVRQQLHRARARFAELAARLFGTQAGRSK